MASYPMPVSETFGWRPESGRDNCLATECPAARLRELRPRHFNDGAALALELGHSNVDIVFRHYRHPVKAKDAARYWKITPSTKPSNVVKFNRAA